MRPLEIRGPLGGSDATWVVYVAGRPLLGYVALEESGYCVTLWARRHTPWTPFTTLAEAAQALADFHAGDSHHQ